MAGSPIGHKSIVNLLRELLTFFVRVLFQILTVYRAQAEEKGPYLSLSTTSNHP